MGSIVDAAAAVISSKEKSDEEILMKKKPIVVFVLGGPGGGKSTQCINIAKEIGYTHLSSGELLRKASKLDPENGIESMLKEGLSVPPDYTMKIIQKAMEESKNDKFLLDGFPRDEEIRAAFEAALNIEPELVLFFDCSEEERERRILSRNQGRVDDNAESVRKRFRYFEEHTLPVVEYYNSRGKVIKIDAGKPMEEVFAIVKSYLTSPNVHSEAVIEAEAAAEAVIEAEAIAEAVIEAEAAAEAVIEAEAIAEAVIEAEAVDETVIGTVIEDESKSSAQSEVLAVAEDDTSAAEAKDKAGAKVEVSETEVESPSKFDLERDIMKMKL